MVGVAQLVEPQIVDLVVVGSSPIVHPTPPLGTNPGTEGFQPSTRARRSRSQAIKIWQYCTPNRLAFDAIHNGPLAQLGRAVDS